MKYKEGDKVRIKSLDWYNENINNNGIIICGSESFTHPMSHFCDKVVTIVTIQDDCYRILEDDGDWYWADEMIEGLVEEKTKNWVDISIPDGPYTVTYDSPSMNDSMNKNNIHNEIILPRGYIFKDENSNVINATKIVLEKREYPKTYEECCDVLSISSYYKLRYYTYEHGYNEYATSNQLCSLQDKLNILGKLIICRNAYWKLYGDEMGLGKPWEPKLDNNEMIYYIYNVWGKVYKSEGFEFENKIFAFPTAEMRDAFYENFKELIKSVKELL